MPTSQKQTMISVEAALASLIAAARPPLTEFCALEDLSGRVAADALTSQLTQPPFAASAMDGYAVQFADMKIGATLKIIGEAPAGTPFEGDVGAGEAVRIFTGGVVPPGADHVIIQEDVTKDGEAITIDQEQPHTRNIRAAGIDFNAGEILVSKGERLNAVSASVLAAANIDRVKIYKKPIVAIFSNGDELREPGAALKRGEIINSNHYGICALVRAWGGQARYLGCAKDNIEAIKAMIDAAKGADIIVPIGGASVGDYDYVKDGFKEVGGQILFEKVAVRPGKPTWHGKRGAQTILGLPGNPASALVTSTVFLKPLIAHMSGQLNHNAFNRALTAAPLPSNGPRETYMRAKIELSDEAILRVRAAPKQDSSLLRPFLIGEVLIKRAPHAPACNADEIVEIIHMNA